MRVVLLDEALTAGGQVYRAPPSEMRLPKSAKTDDLKTGNALRASLSDSPVQARFARRVWSVVPGFRMDALGPESSETYAAPRLVAATGAHERVVPFPGWTLPGVIGLAAATILLKSQAMLPGRRVVVAGCGPLLVAVAAKITAAGGAIEAVVDLASPAEWLALLPRLATRPSLLAEGIGWSIALGRSRVPVLFRHTIRCAEGADAVTRAVAAPVDRSGRPTGGPERAFTVDALIIGHGLTPGSEIPRLLGAEHKFDRLRGGWVPIVDSDGHTSIKGLYAVGDGAGIAGAAPAALAGYLAGLAAAGNAGFIPPDELERKRRALHVKRDRAMRFAEGMSGLMALRSGLVEAIDSDTIVCRCEDVTRGQIEAAIAAGAGEVNQLKHFTRCGMGPCQGRMCGEVVGEIVARHAGSREAAGLWTMRPPLRPILLDALLGSFDYKDIPVPEPAPL
jgi:thioredoxin reductase/bacterioferritin-associated ferredoxin